MQDQNANHVKGRKKKKKKTSKNKYCVSSLLLFTGILIKISIKDKHFQRSTVQCQTNLFPHR